MEEVTRKPRKKLATPRPPSADVSKRPTLSFRVGTDLSEKLRASAEANQTSISEEIERRLTASFAKVHDAPTEAVLSLIAANFVAIQNATQSSWATDPATQVMCAKAAETTIQAFGATIAQADSNFNVVRETNRKEAESGGIGAAVLVLETVLHGRSDDFAQAGFHMLSAAAEKNKMRNQNAVLVRLLREGAANNPAVSLATPDELVDMAPAPGLLPPELGDRAAFDDAVAELPLVKAEKAAPKPRYTVQGALKHDQARRKAKTKAVASK